MDKNDNLQIGLALNHIAMSVDDETLETIKPWLNRIEEIVLRDSSDEHEVINRDITIDIRLTTEAYGSHVHDYVLWLRQLFERMTGVEDYSVRWK